MFFVQQKAQPSIKNPPLDLVLAGDKTRNRAVKCRTEKGICHGYARTGIECMTILFDNYHHLPRHFRWTSSMLARVAMLLALISGLSGCGPKTQTSNNEPSVSFTEDELDLIRTLSPLPPMAPDPTNRFADLPAAAQFGQRLFYEPRLSADGSIACGSCHAFKRGFGDGGTLARGLGPLTRHSMALWNVAYHDWLFWDGRADTLWSVSPACRLASRTSPRCAVTPTNAQAAAVSASTGSGRG